MDIRKKFSKPIKYEPFISKADVDTYLEDGYLVVHNLLNKQEVQEINDDIITILRGNYNIKNISNIYIYIQSNPIHIWAWVRTSGIPRHIYIGTPN